MAINVIKPGLSSSIQDAGREGYYHLGIPPSGALDRYSLACANLLAGNEPGSAALECTLMGPTIQFEQDTLFAISGAPMTLTLDDQPVPANTCLQARCGQQLKIGFTTSGARTYLAIAGGFDTPLMLGSRSTYVLGALGGYLGRTLQPGDLLPVSDACNDNAHAGKTIPPALQPVFSKSVSLRMVPGLYIDRLTAGAVAKFFSTEWTVSTESDRIGYRLQGDQELEFVPRSPPFGAGSDPSNIVDACYPIGSVQIPAGRTPIVLHRDAVSGGGYMMSGTVISCDLDILGQLPPNSKVKFVQVTLEQALQARTEYQRRIQQLADYITGIG